MLATIQRITNRIAIGASIVFVLMLCGFGLSFYVHQQEEKSNQWVVHTYQVIDELKDIANLLTDAETGVRGYTLTRRKSFLEAYRALNDTLPEHLKTLQGLVKDNARQYANAKRLGQMIDTRVVIFGQTIEAREQGNDEDVVRHIEQGRHYALQIREWINMMIEEENRLLNSRKEDVAYTFLQTNIISAFLLLFTFITLWAGYRQLRSELERRERNETQLLSYDLTLQKKVTELQRSNEDLQRFAYVASHDLQEPLRKIQTYISLINETYRTELPEEVKPYLERIRQAAERSSALIRDLLIYSRVSNQVEKFQLVDLQRIVAEALDELEIPITEQQARVEVGILPKVDAMPGQMRHLFQNLISNALKYRRPDVAPEIQIQSRVLENDESDKTVYEITITDNGIGFDEKYAEQIFEPFKRLHNGAAYKGTGIGLAICKKVMLTHGGTITATSILGQGARFTFTIPARQQASPFTPAEP